MLSDYLSGAYAQNSSNFQASETLSNISRLDLVYRKDMGHPKSDSIVTLSKTVLKKYAPIFSPPLRMLYEIDSKSNRIVINIVDPISGEVIHKILEEKTSHSLGKLKNFKRRSLP